MYLRFEKLDGEHISLSGGSYGIDKSRLVVLATAADEGWALQNRHVSAEGTSAIPPEMNILQDFAPDRAISLEIYI